GVLHWSSNGERVLDSTYCQRKSYPLILRIVMIYILKYQNKGNYLSPVFVFAYSSKKKNWIGINKDLCVLIIKTDLGIRLNHHHPMNKLNKSIVQRINIFLSLDQQLYTGYFNPQDPAPVYKRQLSHEFEQYIM